MKESTMKYLPEKMELCEPNAGLEAAPTEGKAVLNVKAPQIGPALPGQAPKIAANPAKLVPPASANITSSSQRDTQTRLISSGVLRGSQEKDEYLLRLLGKGSKPPLPSAAPTRSNGFRVPDPVPHRAAQASNRPFPSSAVELGGAREKGSNPAGGQTATASGQPTSEVAPGWSYSETQRRIGTDAAGSLRATFVAHQVVFLEQLYDLHRAIAVQKLLVRNCPEVKHLMDEATRIIATSSSGQKDQITGAVAAGNAAGATVAAAAVAPQAKRPRIDNERPTTAARAASLPATAAVPPATMAAPASAPAAAALALDEPIQPMDDDGEPGLRPDSQFAAVPLPGETAATGDGSGDDGDGSGPNGSGGNGSGGGSNSPQPQLPPVQHFLPPRRLLPLQGAPSEASQAPMMFPRTNFMAPPWIQPLMPMQMQMPPGMYPGVAGGDPLAGTGGMPPPHYHQQYANLAQMQMAASQMGGGAPGGVGGPMLGASGALQVVPTNAVQQMANAAAVAAPLATAGPAAAGAAPASVPAAPAVAAPFATAPVLVSNPAVPAPGASGQPGMSRPQTVPQALPAAIAPSPAAQVAAAGGDPMAWWAQHYYGRQQQLQQAMQMQMQMAAQMLPPQNAQQAQQMATAAAVAAFGNPGGAGTYRWWQDPSATFGPPVDLNVVAAGLAATRKAGNAAGEAESAPPSSAAAAAATATAVAAAAAATATTKQKGSQLAAPASARLRRSKRKPSDPIEEASSGTTGQDHHLGPHAVTDDAHFKSRSPHGSRGIAPGAAADTSAAKLLLSFSNKGHVA